MSVLMNLVIDGICVKSANTEATLKEAARKAYQEALLADREAMVFQIYSPKQQVVWVSMNNRQTRLRWRKPRATYGQGVEANIGLVAGLG